MPCNEQVFHFNPSSMFLNFLPQFCIKGSKSKFVVIRNGVIISMTIRVSDVKSVICCITNSFNTNLKINISLELR